MRDKSLSLKTKRLDLRRPDEARLYIREFQIPGLCCASEITQIETNTGRTIYFNNMSDDDACIAAHLLHDLLIKASKNATRH